jgi:predicted nucleic acid-binding protein
MVTAAELLVRPIRSGHQQLAYAHDFLTQFPNLHGLVMDLHVAQRAATLRATSGLRLPDAIVIASGLLAGCEAIVTNDERWKHRLAPLFSQFRWIYLGDLA